MVQNLVADSLSNGFFTTSIIPKVNMISEIAVNTRKSMFDGNKLVNGNSKNERVAKAPDRTINLKPNSRPQDTIQVFLPPFLSPSMSGISTLPVNNICKNSMGMTKMKKGRFKVPIKLK